MDLCSFYPHIQRKLLLLRFLAFSCFICSAFSFTYIKKWDGGTWVQDNAQDDALVEGSFRRTQAYDRCEDVKLDTTIRFNSTFDTIRVRMERGRWYGENTDPTCGGTATTITARSETYTRRGQVNEALFGFAFRYDPDSDVNNDCPLIIFQRHASVSSPSPRIAIRNSQYEVSIRKGPAASSTNIREYIAPAAIREWEAFVLHYRLTTNESLGFVNIWLNDELVYSYTGATTYDGLDDEPGYIKWGFYMANLYSGSCTSPSQLNVWAANYARIAYAAPQGGIVGSYEHISPNRRRALSGVPYPTTTGSSDTSSDDFAENLISNETYVNNTPVSDSHPIHRLWDGCIDAGVCTTGSREVGEFSVWFNFRGQKALTTARVFGDDAGTWVCNNWTLATKVHESDPWSVALENEDCYGIRWFERELADLKAGYAMVTFRGYPTVEVAEFELYGVESLSGSPLLSPLWCLFSLILFLHL